MLMMRPLAGIRSGTKADTMRITPKTLTSNVWRTSGMERSVAGTVCVRPLRWVGFKPLTMGVRADATYALLTKMSSVPPVSLVTAFWQVTTLSSSVTSSGRQLMPSPASVCITAGLRAVAMTWNPLTASVELGEIIFLMDNIPFALKARHISYPIPPGVHLDDSQSEHAGLRRHLDTSPCDQHRLLSRLNRHFDREPSMTLNKGDLEGDETRGWEQLKTNACGTSDI